MKLIIKLFGNRTKLRQKTGIAERTASKYANGEMPIESLKLGHVINIAKALNTTEQEVINMLLQRG